jgi:WD40 repeat protein
MTTSPREVLTSALALFLMLTLVLGLLGCSDDDCETCPTCPEPKTHNDIYDGFLYVGLSGVPYLGDTDIYIIDTKTEQVVDSITYPQRDALALDVTPDGKLLAVSDAQATTRVYDTRTKEILASFDMQAVRGFAGNGRHLLLHRLKTWIYSVPDLQLVHEDTIDIGDFYSSVDGNFYYSVADFRLFYQYSFDSLKVVRTWQPHDRDGERYSLWNFDLSDNDRLLHMIVAAASGPAFATWDLEADSLINEHPIAAGNGEVCANPYGDEVYLTEPGFPLSYGLGTIYIFDRQTGEYLEGISLYGYNEKPWIPLSARHLVVSPDGSQLYVVSDATHWESGTVLRIDTKTRKVESLLFPDIDIYPLTIAIGPRP